MDQLIERYIQLYHVEETERQRAYRTITFCLYNATDMEQARRFVAELRTLSGSVEQQMIYTTFLLQTQHSALHE